MKKTTWIFLLLAAAAGTAVWYFEFKRPKPSELESASKKAFVFKEEDVASLAIARPVDLARGPIVLEKRGTAWRMTRPLDAAPDTSRVDSILYQLASARYTRSFPASPDKLKSFGFENPGVELEVKLASGQAHRVRFADKDFTGGSVYARVNGSGEVLLLPNELLTAVDMPLIEFRDRRIATLREGDAVRVRVRNERLKLLMEKTKDGNWVVLEPKDKKDKEIVETRIFLTLENARASEIFDAPSCGLEARLRRPAVEIEVSMKDGTAASFRFAPLDKEAAVAASSVSPLMFKIPLSNLETLNFKWDEILRTKE
jgi:hypothetical protein